MELYLLSFEGYAIETFAELEAIQDYWHKNDTTALQAIIQQNKQPSPEFRRFVADLVASKIKRPMKKISTFDRDYKIYQDIDDAISDGQTLISITRIIADKNNLSIDAINKAYYRCKKAHEAYRQYEQEEEIAEQQELESEYWQVIDDLQRREMENIENTK